MTHAEVMSRIEPIMRDLFDEFSGPITPSLTAKDVGQWDSLANVQLVVMVEKEFGVKFAIGEITRLKDLGALVDLVVARAAEQGR